MLSRLSGARRASVAVAAGVLLAIAIASAVAAGNGLGAYVSLGFNNTIGNYTTRITAAATTAVNAFAVINTATSTARAIYAESRSLYPTIYAWNKGGGPGLWVTVADGKAPIRVNSSAGTASYLSADRLDGYDSSAFARDIEYVAGTESANNSTSPKSATAACPTGKRLLGGGGNVTPADAGAPVALSESRPDSALSVWTATAVEGSGYTGSWSVTAYAICATVTPNP